MNNHKKLFNLASIFCFFMLSFSPAFAQEGIKFLNDVPIDQIIKLAGEKKKMVFIDGYTKTCAPCKELDQKVFPLKEVGEYFNANFISVKYNLEEKEGLKVRGLYKDVITGFPSLILLDTNGLMIHKIGGFHPADSLLSKMKAAVNGTSLSAMRRRLGSGEKSVSFVSQYKQIMADGYLRAEMGGVSEKILGELSDAELVDPKMWALLGSNVTDPYSPVFARVVNNFWMFYQKKTTDMAFLEFQLRSAIVIASDQIVNPREGEDKITIVSEPKKQTLLLGFVSNPDRFKQTESIRAKFYVHDAALKADWREMVGALGFYRKIGALGSSSSFIYQYVRYMAQYCKNREVLKNAAELIKSLPKEKLDVMDRDDNYATLIRLYQLIGDKTSVIRYKKLQHI